MQTWSMLWEAVTKKKIVRAREAMLVEFKEWKMLEETAAGMSGDIAQ